MVFEKFLMLSIGNGRHGDGLLTVGITAEFSREGFNGVSIYKMRQ